MLDYSISYARTVAGLHHPSDNIAGLMIDQDILGNRRRVYEISHGGKEVWIGGGPSSLVSVTIKSNTRLCQLPNPSLAMISTAFHWLMDVELN